jgi:hypothetical protein
VYEIPAIALPYDSGDARREIVISFTRPCWYAQHRNALEDLAAGQPPSPVGGHHGDVEAADYGQSTRDFVDVRLGPTRVW